MVGRGRILFTLALFSVWGGGETSGLIVVEDAKEQVNIGFRDGLIEADANRVRLEDTEIDAMLGGDARDVGAGRLGKANLERIEERGLG